MEATMKPFRRLIDIAKWRLSAGRGQQTFLGAGWIKRFLDRTNDPAKKRKWALRLLSLSPHYFINSDAPKFQGMPFDEYLEETFQDGVRSREIIFAEVFEGRFLPEDVALDYGCGPGFVAGRVAPHVKKLFACDISEGALACARVLNAAPNLEYVLADSEEFEAKIADASLDVVVSYAMVQHLSDEIFEHVLSVCQRKLKCGGRLLLHIQLPDESWRTEKEWRDDKSLEGRLKLRYGLHCFSRTADEHFDLIKQHRFDNLELTHLGPILSDNPAEAASQALITAVKP